MAPSWWPAVKKIMDGYGVPEAVWVPIMWGESRGNPAATNDTRGRTDLPAGTVPEYSVGLFQVNVLARYPNATPEQLDSYADQLRDPETNASLQGQRIATAWNALKDQLQSQPPETWAAVVAVRSGHPAGSVDHPCVSDWCKRYQGILSERSANMLPLINQGIDFFTAGVDWMGRIGGSIVSGATTAVGNSGALAGATQSALGVGGNVGVQALASGMSFGDKLQEVLDKIDWYRVIVFVIGLGLVLIAVASILGEQAAGPLKTVARVAAKATDNPAETALDIVGG